MNIFSKIWNHRWMIRAFIPSLILNFKQLPFRQACKLPIIIYKPHFGTLDGKIIIQGDVRFNMIQLGRNLVSLFPNNGIRFGNSGKIIFKGRTCIGNSSSIFVGKNGILTFGDLFNATAVFSVICYNDIKFGYDIVIGWNCTFIDTDFHVVKNMITGEKTKGYGSIRIGDGVWIANSCKIYKNVEIPSKTIVGADTILHKPVACEPGSLIINEHKVIVRNIGYYMDMRDDTVVYDKKV